MPSLSDKLKSLGVKLGTRELPPPRPRGAHSIQDVVPGEIHATPFGEAFFVRTTYPSAYRHGHCALSTTASLGTIAEWAREPRLAQCSADRMVFLDIETTGLSGGAGTFAFLVGIGRLDGEGFQLIQLFMRDPVEERALLSALAEMLEPLDALVTFNGKSFDAPILRTRYVINGHAVPFSSAAHLDLLPLARRLWRDRLESRALGSLETHILGARRAEDDIAGWLIPQMYFDYLQNGDARPLRGVFYHNAMDVVAMAALLGHVAEMLADPFAFSFVHGLDLIAVARLFEGMGRWDEAARLYARGLEYEVSEETFRETVRRLSFLQRRRGEMDSALELWREAAGTQQIYALVELAKYYEHKARDYAEAERRTRAAIEIIGARPEARRRWINDLEHRLRRLEQKNGRHRERPSNGS